VEEKLHLGALHANPNVLVIGIVAEIVNMRESVNEEGKDLEVVMPKAWPTNPGLVQSAAFTYPTFHSI